MAELGYAILRLADESILTKVMSALRGQIAAPIKVEFEYPSVGSAIALISPEMTLTWKQKESFFRIGGAMATSIYFRDHEDTYLFSFKNLQYPNGRTAWSFVVPASPVPWISKISPLFPPISDFKQLSEVFGPDHMRLIEGREEDLTRLLKLHEQMISTYENFAKIETARLSNEREAIENFSKTEREKIQLERESLRQETVQERAELDAKIKALDKLSSRAKRQKDGDELTKRLLEQTAALLNATEITTKSHEVVEKSMIRTIMWSGITFGGLLLVHVIPWFQPTSTYLQISLIATKVVAGFTFIGFLSYYIRWRNEWLQKLSSREIESRRTGVDIQRAQWVIELITEFKQLEGVELEPVMIERLTRGLFSSHSDLQRGDLGPALEALTTLLGESGESLIQTPAFKFRQRRGDPMKEKKHDVDKK